MARRKPADRRPDTRLEVARYQVGKLLGPGSSSPSSSPDEPETDAAGQTTMDARAQYVEIQIQQAMRRGDFDDLPGAGKPLTGLTEVYDENWWIRRKIEREKLTGLGPPALTLRAEDAALDERIAGAPSEHAVRELLEDFNRRVIEARRQLLGGPPVVTALRDVDASVAAWRAAREARYREAAERAEAERAASRRRR